MKNKYKWLLLLVMAVFLASCTTLQPKRFVDNTNRFYSSYPQVVIDIDKELEYGEKITYNYTLSSPDFAGGVNITAYPFGIANSDNVIEKAVLITFHKMEEDNCKFIGTGLPERNEIMIGTMKFRASTCFIHRKYLDRQQFNKAGYELAEIYVGFVAKRQTSRQEMMIIYYLEKYEYTKKDFHLLGYPKKWTYKQKAAVTDAYAGGMKAITIR